MHGRVADVSPFDHLYLSGLLGDEEVAALLAAAAEIKAMLAFKVALPKAEAIEGIIPADAAKTIANGAHLLFPGRGEPWGRDEARGVRLYFVRQLRAAVGEPHGRHVHLAATSQDVMDSGLILRLARALPI
ncbi:hypothetical protein [Sinorhizobium meliloti]|uniref:Uncharacterized protein n=1 Tax=Rhizobium meliloti TaxID=382 RepID=A0A2J0YU21_RHIML|nr:hypothetical protein [Sinorhizobium meliloti]PJR09896.1 hypothetical protein CEJ86_30245 [Sinorhizobium meliloti]